CLALLLGDLRFDGRRLPRGLTLLFFLRGGDRPHRCLEVGPSVRQALDVEAQARESLGDVVEVLRIRAVVRAGYAADFPGGCGESLLRMLLTQHFERAQELP